MADLVSPEEFEQCVLFAVQDAIPLIASVRLDLGLEKPCDMVFDVPEEFDVVVQGNDESIATWQAVLRRTCEIAKVTLFIRGRLTPWEFDFDYSLHGLVLRSGVFAFPDLIPETLGRLQSLTFLDISGCDFLYSLPETLCDLKSLVLLDLGCSSELTSLPESLGKLGVLRALDLRGCFHLTSLPESLGQLQSLTFLDIRGCLGLGSLPDSIGELGSLKELDFSGCGGLSALPESIGRLRSIRAMKFENCHCLISLPESFGQIQPLELLVFVNCCRLFTLPESIGQLKYLKSLDIVGCASLESLPDTLSELTGLSLHLRDNYGLQYIPRPLWSRMDTLSLAPSVFHGPFAAELFIYPICSDAFRRSLSEAMPVTVTVSQREIHAATQPQIFALVACSHHLHFPRLPVELWFMIWDFLVVQYKLGVVYF